MRYRRIKTSGETYFFTLNLAERNKTLLIDYIDILRNTLNTIKNDILLNLMQWLFYPTIYMP